MVNMHSALVHVGRVCVSQHGEAPPLYANYRLPLVCQGSRPALIGQVEAIYSLTAPVT